MFCYTLTSCRSECAESNSCVWAFCFWLLKQDLFSWYYNQLEILEFNMFNKIWLYKVCSLGNWKFWNLICSIKYDCIKCVHFLDLLRLKISYPPWNNFCNHSVTIEWILKLNWMVFLTYMDTNIIRFFNMQ